MRTIAHIIHPVVVDPASDLMVAQPVTFATMKTAQSFAQGQVDVRLFYTKYSDEELVLPEGFQKTNDLTRSVLAVGTFQKPRKLALLVDILDRLAAATDAEYLIYTNVDIALQPHFYQVVAQLIAQGYDAFIINRRTIPATLQQVAEIPLMYAQVGEAHPGHDCFVFKRSAYQQYRLGNICIGTSRIGAALALNLVYNATQFQEFTDLHLTFHIGDDRVWQAASLQDYLQHNDGEYRQLLAHYGTTFPNVQHPFIEKLVKRFARPSLQQRISRELTRIGKGIVRVKQKLK